MNNLDAIIIASDAAYGEAILELLPLDILDKYIKQERLLFSFINDKVGDFKNDIGLSEPLSEGKFYDFIKKTNQRPGKPPLYLNGILLYSFLKRKGFSAEIINSLEQNDDLEKLMKDNLKAKIIISTTFICSKFQLQEVVKKNKEDQSHRYYYCRRAAYL